MEFFKKSWAWFQGLPVPAPVKYIVAAAVLIIAAQYLYIGLVALFN